MFKYKDFSNQNIQGRSFKGENLFHANFSNANVRGANFSNADIRGTNFSNANLTDTKFISSKAGLQQKWIVVLTVVALFLSSLSGFCSAVAGAWTGFLLTSISNNLVAVLIIITSFLTFIAIILDHGILAVPKALGTAGVIVGILALVGAITGNISLSVSVMAGLSGVIVGTLGGIATMVLTLVVITSNAIFVAWAGAVAGGVILALAVSISVTASVIGSFSVDFLVGTGGFGIALITGVMSAYIGQQAIDGNEKYAFILEIAVDFATIGGTRFCGANLTDADFTKAMLKSIDFRQANLTRIRLYDSLMLDRVRSETTYLKNAQVRQLLTTRQGQGLNFDHQDLRGINLQEANLSDASFIGADLSYADLRNAILVRSKLIQTQLDGCNLTQANLTGAFIQDWGITAKTEFENVQCEYVFMRLPTKENPNPLRKPDNLRETFADGEFSDFVKPFIDTLDLYHRQDFDPRAISIALKNLSANHPDEELKFVAIERRGDNGLNLRYITAQSANKSELSNEYFTDYDRIRRELPMSFQMKLAEKDAEIRSMQGMIEKFIQTGIHNTTVRADIIHVIQAGAIMTENKGININASGNIGDISGLVGGDVSGVVNLGSINGNVTNAINQLPDTTKSDEPSLKELLTQLQQAIQNDKELPDPDKADLLEQVQALAEAKHVEEPTKKEGLTRKAMKMFSATLKSLPDTAKIVDSCSKLLPLVLKALGFAS
ncbi:hypothetical protein APA_4368 [Pseudanabaena sp. lw0831]|uniref:pentapeptide repeat-containing protein n=1 Tax=Pseudanabaena sp. lw0831 TaxID=1357935 RepID=UPI001914F1A6|nr:pentapeptide repeat-containing protein [Pseudanabaena sp. lw0831]GBO52063.1 hypothetical protein APA_4368 [Pseudanabaena sp. lw0831]